MILLIDLKCTALQKLLCLQNQVTDSVEEATSSKKARLDIESRALSSEGSQASCSVDRPREEGHLSGMSMASVIYQLQSLFSMLQESKRKWVWCMLTRDN